MCSILVSYSILLLTGLPLSDGTRKSLMQRAIRIAADAAGTGMERVGFPILSYPLNRRAGSTTPLASPFSTYFSTTAQDPATFLVQKEAVQTKATSNKLRGPAFE